MPPPRTPSRPSPPPATALIEQIRSYKLVRAIRDMLAEQLRAAERDAADRLTEELDTALEIALLAE